ncbi:hypothetical protein HK098_006661 [Nowakowskiella sp. JEL0407]|nr:hypothetical protein HK098_006661 [Nowakowskiella sp. JEL0407]
MEISYRNMSDSDENIDNDVPVSFMNKFEVEPYIDYCAPSYSKSIADESDNTFKCLVDSCSMRTILKRKEYFVTLTLSKVAVGTIAGSYPDIGNGIGTAILQLPGG